MAILIGAVNLGCFLGCHEEFSLRVTFLTYDGATWCFRDQDRSNGMIRYGNIIIDDNFIIGSIALFSRVFISENKYDSWRLK